MGALPHMTEVEQVQVPLMWLAHEPTDVAGRPRASAALNGIAPFIMGRFRAELRARYHILSLDTERHVEALPKALVWDRNVALLVVKIDADFPRAVATTPALAGGMPWTTSRASPLANSLKVWTWAAPSMITSGTG